MDTAPALSPCKYCHQQCRSSSEFCCQACELLFKIDYKSWVPQADQSLLQKKNQYMDSDDFKSFYKNPENESEFSFYVEGLQCASCIHLIEKIPEFYPQVTSIQVNFGLSLITVQATREFKLSQFLALLDELGYKGTPLSKNENLSEKYKSENRASLKRIAVAGACAGNIMLFVVPIYGGLSGTYATAFNWISFVLFLPIVFYSSVPFYQGAWNSLRYRVINVDLPIVIALLTGFIFSTVNLILGKPDIYFDSTASFLFLILSTRYLVKRIQQKTLSESSIMSFLPVQTVEYKTELGKASKLSLHIHPGDTLIIQPGQIIPADGKLSSFNAEVDNSLLNGESLPQTLAMGMEVYAGTRALNKPFEIKVERTLADTEIGKIVSSLEKESLKKTPFVTRSENISHWLIAIVFSIAIIFFFVYGGLVSYDAAFNRALALIVIACPCALAFGTPLTYALSLRKARDLGILIKNGNVFEKVGQLKTLFFDKTGTLTSGQLSLMSSFPCEIPADWKQLILGLECRSRHPMAFAFRKSWPDIIPASFISVDDIPGVGIRGSYEGSIYSLESNHAREETGLMSVKLKKDDSTLAYFYFSDELQADTKNVIELLKQKKYEIGIISGDRKAVVEKIAHDTGVDPRLIFSHRTPQQKLDVIKLFPYACMIGDGANDSLALSQAHVGISVKGSVSLSHNSSEVCFTRPGLKSILDLIRISKRSQQILKLNLGFALFYNFLGGTLALLGYINPLVAAILMPISSLLIIINTYRGLK
ncbi:MAG: heavy metal translocating P-type ATPase [Bdellovibrionaceae bacterium]|nr:heavy metal translocating P-type ATPase [Pseudobdellovibrionaceae bacterium]